MKCIIPGCENDADNNIGVRLRRPDTTAIWAPNTDAFLCSHHAKRGLIITVILEPTQDHKIKTRVCGVAETTKNRTTQIRQE
jgi:hypothetical protein